MGNALDDYLPIRRILVDGVATPLVRDLDFDSSVVGIEVDEAAGVARVSLPTAPAEGFTPVLILDRNTRQTVSAEDLDDEGAIQLAFAASGHAAGAQKSILIPAGTLADADMLRVASDLDPTGLWDPINVDNDYAIFVTALSGTQCAAMGRDLGTRTTAAPTVVSATIDGADPDKLLVAWSAAVYLPDLTGLSLTFNVGTARTITAIVSGNGTDTVTFDLSGDVADTDDIDFVIGSTRTGRSMNGVLLATSTTAVTLTGFIPASLEACAAWTRCFESGVQMAPSTLLPATFTSWTDQVGGSATIVRSDTGSGNPQRIAAGAIEFANDATDRCETAVTGFAAANFAIFVRARNTSGANGIAIAFDTDGASNVWLYIRIESNAIGISLMDGTETTLDDSFTTGTGYHNIYVERTGSTVTLTVEGRSAVTVSSSKNLSAVTNLSVGNLVFAGPTAFLPLTGAVSDIAFKAASAFTVQEKADIAERIAGR